MAELGRRILWSKPPERTGQRKRKRPEDDNPEINVLTAAGIAQ
jgi:hypothetical protein